MHFDIPSGHYRLEPREAALLSNVESSIDRRQLSWPVSDAEFLLGAAKKAHASIFETTPTRPTSLLVDDLFTLDVMVATFSDDTSMSKAAPQIVEEIESFLRSQTD